MFFSVYAFQLIHFFLRSFLVCVTQGMKIISSIKWLPCSECFAKINPQIKQIITVFTVAHTAVCTVSISHTYFVPELHFVLYFLFFAGFRNYLGCSRTFGRWMDVCIVCVAQSMISIWSRLTRHLISVRMVFFSFSLMIVGYTGYQLFFCFVYIAVSFLVLCVCLFVFELGFNQRLTMQI